MNDTFREIYDKNEWGYGSGVGSLPLNNIEYIKFVRTFIERNAIQSVVDFGCGDWQFSRFMGWGDITYIGFDVVEEVIARNRKLFAGNAISFHLLTPQTDLPTTDLIICKDVFQHLPNGMVQQYLELFKRRGRFLLITNDDWPAENQINAQIAEGGWRPLRLDRAPFSEIAPVVLSWMVEWGGWKPTRKSTSLIIGRR
jgi:SAM-dependent methyltransferase